MSPESVPVRRVALHETVGGLDDQEIVELMVELVRAAARPRGKLPG